MNPTHLTAVDLQRALQVFWPSGRAFPPTAPWLKAYYTRPQAMLLARAIATELATSLRQTRGVQARDKIQAWLVKGRSDGMAAGVAFWRRILYECLSLRNLNQRRAGMRWGADSPALQPTAGVVELSRLESLWWLPRRVRFYPERWLYDVVAPLTQPGWAGPLSWSAVSEVGAVQLKIWAPSGALRTPTRQAELGQRPCCTTAVTLSWMDSGGEVVKEMPMTSYAQVAGLLESGQLQGFRTEQVEVIQGVLRRFGAELGDEDSDIAPLCEDRPHKGAGLGANQRCCYSEVENEGTTLYVSKRRGSIFNTGEDRDNPTTIERVRSLLSDPDKVYRALTVYFLRGETWTAKDLDPTTDTFLTIRSSGRDGNPIRIGAYYHSTYSTSRSLPLFYGNGQESKTLLVNTEASCTGFKIEGASWVQVDSLEVANCRNGITVMSYFDSKTGPTLERPLRGPRNIQLYNMTVRENWRKGILVSTNWLPLQEGEEGFFVIGDGTLYFHSDNPYKVLREISVDPDGWWPEAICIEPVLFIRMASQVH